MLCHSYPDATPEDLQATDNVCIICREEMVTGAKKLPCNHIFHSRFMSADWQISVPLVLTSACIFQIVCSSHCSCLRSWFQRQQTCPTCRMDVLRASQPNQTPAPAAAQAPAPAAPANAPVPPPVNGKTSKPGRLICWYVRRLLIEVEIVCLFFCAVAPGMMPQFPPGLFPFWGPFPGAPPPAAPGAQAATDTPQTSTDGTQAQGSGEHLSSVLPACENVEIPWFS